jgi:hypothetical protein
MNERIVQLDDLDGHEFEALMVEIFDRLGYHVERGPQSGDGGRDLIVTRANETTVVECKHHKGLIGRPAVQKLHSAGIHYRSTVAMARRAILVSTSSFSNEAIRFAREVNEQTDFVIELWDYSRLLAESRKVRIILLKDQDGAQFVFEVDMRDESKLKDDLWKLWFRKLRSFPRPIESSVQVGRLREETIAAIAVDFSIDKSFSTQVGIIHHANASGRVFYPLANGRLTSNEIKYWGPSQLKLLPRTHVTGRLPVALFGVSPQEYAQKARTDIAAEQSRLVTYYGRNNQRYEKFCQVSDSDVSVNASQVVLYRKYIPFQIGVKKYETILADDASRIPCITATIGLGKGEEGFIGGNAQICNDCGDIVVLRNGHGPCCAECGRTLCKVHIWRYPLKPPARWKAMCSKCYLNADHVTQGLEGPGRLLDRPAALYAASLVPGLPFFVNERRSGFFGLPIAFLSVFIAFFVSNFWGIAVLVTAVVTSVCATMYWRVRMTNHEKTVTALLKYRPPWE